MEYGIRQNVIDDQVIIEIRSSDGIWQQMATPDIEVFVKDYIHVGEYEDFQGEGFIRLASDNYLYYNNGKISGGGNQIAGDFCAVIEKIPSEINGNLFYLDNAIKAPDNAAELMLHDPELTAFADLLYEANLLDSVQADYEIDGVLYPRISFLSGLKQWTVLAPTNQAIADAELLGIIPEDEIELKDFIYYHFVRDKCIFDDGETSGIWPTHLQDTVIGSDVYYKTLDFSNSIHNLSVEDLSGQVISIDHNDANNLIETGVIHKVNSVLRIEP
jgi:hypothetical protein